MLGTTALFFIRVFNILSKAFAQGFEGCSKVWSSLEGAFASKQYLFFENNPAPYFHTTVNESASGSAKIEWIYDTDSKTFTEFDAEAEEDGVNAPLPILSMEIMYKDKVYYDLTDFIENVRIKAISEDCSPCIPHILGAWSLSSGIVLDLTRGFEVRLIDSAADTIMVSLHDYKKLHHLLEKREENAGTEEIKEDVIGSSGSLSAIAEAVRGEAEVASAESSKEE